MASDTVHTAEILVERLATKSVTFAPARATVVREIPYVQIKPGHNEITIFGLDSNVDLDSIRVEGRGPAQITDIQTEIVPQRKLFEEVYPTESDEEVSDSDDSDDDDGVDKTALEKARQDLRDMEDNLAAARNQQSAAVTSLEFLDHYGRTLDSEDAEVPKVAEFLSFYLEQRATLGDKHQKSNTAIVESDRQVKLLARKVARLEGAYEKAKNAASKEKRKTREKKLRETNQKRKQRQRESDEKRKFWPWNVSQVVLHLDGLGALTPGSSRRSSITSGKKPETSGLDLSHSKPATVNLSLTYVTPRATWNPRYELSLNTPGSSGKVVYRAEFQNCSSETWRDAKVILSTSQTSFSGLDERIPTLQAWHVKLGKVDENPTGQKNSNWTGGLENRIEVNARMTQGMKQSKPFATNNAGLFGNSNANNNASSLFGSNSFKGQTGFAPQQHQPALQMAQQAQQAQQAQHQKFQQAQAQQAPGQPSGLFGSAPAPMAPAAVGTSLFGSRPSNTAFGGFGNSSAAYEPNYSDELIAAASLPLADEDDPDLDSETLSASSNILAYQESSRQDYGLTTTYDLPGVRTLAPSSLKRRHVIAELDLKSITLSHVLIPKLRPAAFLRARIKNTSDVTLLRGKAGLTLDGTFLGSITLPSCAPDNTFNLSLGIDPSILVTYAKPTVRRSTTGFFNKEESAIFTRVCWIKNTKSSPVTVSVFDQVPMSEDERLRVNILEPKSLEKEGDKTKLNPGKEGWGKGLAVMGKNGELKWDITLEKGKDVKLVLEYEAKIPSGQKIVGLD